MQQGISLNTYHFTCLQVYLQEIPRRRILGAKVIYVYNFDIAKLTSIEIIPVYTPQIIYESLGLNF